MPKPWEITIDEARAAGERMRARFEAADRFAAPLLARQLAEDSVQERLRQQREEADRLDAPILAKADREFEAALMEEYGLTTLDAADTPPKRKTRRKSKT